MREVLAGVILIVTMLPIGTFAEQNIDLRVNVTAHGVRTAVKVDDKTCQFGFPGLIEDPALVVLGDDGDELLRGQMGEGDWSMSDGTAYCKQTYEISLPSFERYTI